MAIPVFNSLLANSPRKQIMPSSPSRGATQIDPQSDGSYRIGSFFDIFPEISLDGGQTWSPASNGPVRMELTQPPSSNLSQSEKPESSASLLYNRG